MDDLVWSVELHSEADARQRLLDLVPGLLKSLRDGLTSAAFDPFATSEFFSQLEALHVQAFQHFARQQELQEDNLAAPESTPEMVQVVEEIVLLAAGEQPVGEPLVRLADDDVALLQVDTLRVGCWVEIHEEDDQAMRCKLATIIEPTGRYVFVNRRGMKVLEKTRMGLAVEFRRGAIRLLDDTLLFDRALESVISNLRRLKRD
jgi:hypothetical protein